ncbi:hypothetical protein ACFV6F_32250 [Kitasatospora phosalacinea]|uniref:hypothetical protein n=1 Tax=Kitasatospora phosalacinea TaxID=2065 RepID=UPI003652F3A7
MTDAALHPEGPFLLISRASLSPRLKRTAVELADTNGLLADTTEGSALGLDIVPDSAVPPIRVRTT